MPSSHFELLRHMASSSLQEEEVRCCHLIDPTLLKSTFSAHCFFYSFTASGGYEVTTAGRVLSPRSIVEHHGFRSQACKNAKC